MFESGFNHDDGGDSDVEPAQSFFFFKIGGKRRKRAVLHT